MGIFGYLKWAVRAFVPDWARALGERSGGELLRFFIALHFFAILLSAVLYIPMVATVPGEAVESVSSFNVKVTYNATGPVTVLSRPRVAIDEAGNASGWITVSEDAFTYRKGVFFAPETVIFSESDDLEDNLDVLRYFTVFFLPALFVWLFLGFLVKNLLLTGLTAFLVWLCFLHPARNLSFTKAWKAGLIAAVPLIFIDIVLWPLVVWVVPSLLFIIYAFVVAWWLSET